jgi:hypothetical protein
VAPAHNDHPLLEVDVRPSQAAELAPAHARVDRRREQGRVGATPVLGAGHRDLLKQAPHVGGPFDRRLQLLVMEGDQKLAKPLCGRRGEIAIVRQVNGMESITEISRFMTTFGWPAKWAIDVTDLRPLLSGDVTLQLSIDTWAGPASGGQGLGWKVDASFDMHGGLPSRLPIAVIPLWDELSYEYGNPMKPVADAVKPQTVTLPKGATAELRSFITGHGQGNAGNCSAFCQKEHGFMVGSTQVRKIIWRPDCSTTAMHGATGTWMYPRAGWCPGSDVQPWIEDVTAAAPAGKDVMISYAVAPYENTCRPDSPMCAGCTATSCPYDNVGHTTSNIVMSSALVVFGSPAGP